MTEPLCRKPRDGQPCKHTIFEDVCGNIEGCVHRVYLEDEPDEETLEW